MRRVICFFFILVVFTAIFAVSVSAVEYTSVTQLLDDTAAVVADSQQGISDSVPAPPPTNPPAEAQVVAGTDTPIITQESPLPVVVLPSDDISSYSVAGSGYTGSISTTILNYFDGILVQNPKSDYVVFKSDRFNTYLFYGDNFKYSGSVFSGYGNYVCYNSESQLYSRGLDSFSLHDAGYYVYTNLDKSHPVLSNAEGVKYEKVVPFALGVFFCLYVFDRIFFRRSSY